MGTLILALAGIGIIGYAILKKAGTPVSATAGTGGGSVPIPSPAPSPTPSGVPLLPVSAPAVSQPPVPNSIGGGFSGLIQTWAWGISLAEGYGPNVNLPTRANNPGDLTAGDSWGYAVLGTANKEGVLIFTPGSFDGWLALFSKLSNIAAGNSSVYPLTMDMYDFAVQYTGQNNTDSNSWAETVASALGVDPAQTLSQILGGS